MTRSLLPCAVAVLCAVPLGCGYSPDQTLKEVEKALAREDVAAFRDTLSAPTIDYLRAWLGNEKVDDAVAFMMGRLRANLPWQVVLRERQGMYATWKVTTKTGPGTLRFLLTPRGWKLDLVEEYRAWRNLSHWAEEVGGEMRRASPLLGFEGPGARFLDLPPAAPVPGAEGKR